MKSKFLNFLGLARRSGNLILGGNLNENVVKRRNLKLLIIASDASSNTEKKFTDMCTYSSVPFITGVGKEEMGLSLGKGEISVIGVKDPNMAEKLKELAMEM